MAAKGKIVSYVGYDCTASSLHIGHLLSIMMLTWLQKTSAGKPSALMGGGTTRVGDPSGRDETRRILTLEQIEDNKNGIKSVFEKFLTFGDGPGEAMMTDNAEWLAPLNYIDFLRDVGKHFSVNRMLWSWHAAMTAICRWVVRTSGATSLPASTSDAAWERISSTR